MRTIYIEYIFINNFAINYLICYLTLLSVRADQKIWRLVLASGLGALFSALYPFMTAYRFMVKIILSLAMVLILQKEFTWRNLILTIILFYLISFVFAGAALLLEDYLNDESLLPFAVSGGIVLAVGMIRITIAFLYNRKNSAVFEYRVEVDKKEGGCLEAVGYFDTGNKLTDSKNQPVVVISRDLADRLSPPIVGEMAVNTVAGVRMLPLVDLNYKIYYGKHQHKIYHSKAVVSDSLDGKSYQMILHRDMVSG
jgi:stage II sporulation protein GA (sporulation sigma-E factor processing peptidase)